MFVVAAGVCVAKAELGVMAGVRLVVVIATGVVVGIMILRARAVNRIKL